MKRLAARRNNTTIFGLLCALCASVVNPAVAQEELPTIEVNRDNIEVRESARIVINEDFIADEDGNGVIHVLGNDLIIDFTDARLRGAAAETAPDQYTGIGVRITGSNNTIRGGRFSGYKVAIFAENANGLTIEDANVSDNFRQRLKSTPQQEDSSDWLWPHNNDNREWMTNYGGGIVVESSENITIRRNWGRDVQNGILLRCVNNSRIYDNDCSFLSGWGLAMWRSNGNTISRNAFDFCIRGYSHGVYNRGQDSAGILMFEQCSNNIIAQNSATHGGDGLFAFAGKEALGEVDPRDELSWYERRGNNDNLIIDNDFSYAAAHGLELTFSFGNTIARNRLAGNAICGIWGGFSQGTLITLNAIEENGDMPYGSERGGINIEHGYRNVIQENWFRRNAVGVRLWSREHPRLLELPWAKANHKGATENVITFNDFVQDLIVAELTRTQGTSYGRNDYYYTAEFLVADDASLESLKRASRDRPRIDRTQWDDLELYGETEPVGARKHLHGREHIVMTEWGPYDWQEPRLHLVEREANRHAYRVLGGDAPSLIQLHCQSKQRDQPEPYVRLDRKENAQVIEVSTEATGRITPYRIEAVVGERRLIVEDALAPVQWEVVVFPWHTDPRENVEEWRREGGVIREGAGVKFGSPHLRLDFGHAGPSQHPDVPPSVQEAGLPVDRFGVIASSHITLPPGMWHVRSLSDDGIRLWLDDELIIDDWTWHPPKEHVHSFQIDAERTIEVRVEHFELDGYAMLIVAFEGGTE